MQKITLPLTYDFDAGDYTLETIEALADLTRLAGNHVKDVPRLSIHCVVTDDDHGSVEYRIETAQLDSDADPFDWLVDATDSVMPVEASDGTLTLTFILEDDQALLLKAAWPHSLPRLTVEGV